MILLASRSPQRRALLGTLGIPFRVVASGVQEGDDALSNARDKAREVARRSGIPENGAVLGADTEVLLGGRALGKPADEDDARAMLASLAGREHAVETAVVLITADGAREACDVARVRMRPLSAAEIDWYVGCGEWRDRAGGYAIQGRGAALVERVEGDYTTVVGLPLGLLAGLLEQAQLAPWSAAVAAQKSGG